MHVLVHKTKAQIHTNMIFHILIVVEPFKTDSEK